MPNFLDKLFRQTTPPTEVDSSWPVETSGYYDDTSVPVIYSPPEGALQDAWAPTADQVVPGYRGVEEHGVPYNAANNYVIPIAQDDLPDEDVPNVDEVVHQVPIDPIPVNVVSMPVPHGVEHRIATSNLVITSLAQPVLFIGKSQDRSKVTLCVQGSDVVMVASNQQQAMTQGYPVNQWFGAGLVLNTTQPIWVYNPGGANATVYAIEEYEVSVNEHPI